MTSCVALGAQPPPAAARLRAAHSIRHDIDTSVQQRRSDAVGAAEEAGLAS